MPNEHLADPPADVTELLKSWSGGNAESLEQLFTVVYPRLRRIAHSLFRGGADGSMLQPTGVVNELFLKLTTQHSASFASREHFFSLASALMRRILVDHARAERRVKRDGGVQVPLDDELPGIWGMPSADMLDIDRALKHLHRLDPRKSQMVELRFFLGSTSEETADLLKLSKATVDRELRFACGWLYQRLRSSRAADGPA